MIINRITEKLSKKSVVAASQTAKPAHRFTVVFLIGAAAILLASCGGTGAGDYGNNGGGAAESFSATVSGSVSASVSGSGYFMCEEVNGGEFNIAASSSLTENVLLSLPTGIDSGTYALDSEDTIAGTFSATYIGASARSDTYGQNVSGTLTLVAVPSGPGDQVAGSFTFQGEKPSAGSPPMVTVSGDFDFTAGSFSFDFCS